MTFQLAQAPIVFYRFNFIKVAFIYIINPHQLQIVRPAQKEFSARADCRKILKLGKHCFPNLVVRIDGIKAPHQFEIFGGIAFVESARQIRRKLPQKLFTIRRSVFTVLFLLDNHSPDFVVGIDHGEVDSGFRVFSSLRKDIRNALKEVVVDRLADFIVFHRCTARNF